MRIYRCLARSGLTSLARDVPCASIGINGNAWIQTARFSKEAAAPKKKVILPASLPGDTGKFASNLFISSVQEDALDIAVKDMKVLAASEAKFPEIQALVNFDSMDIGAVKKALFKAAKALKVHDVTANFISELAFQSKLMSFNEIHEAFTDLVQMHNGFTIVKITSASALTPQEVQRISQALGKGMLQGQKLYIKSEVKPDLKGGLTIQAGDGFLDLSLDSMIQKVSSI